MTTVTRQPGRKTRAQKIAESLAELEKPTPSMKFLIMMTGDFPEVEPGLTGEDEEESRLALQQEIIEAIEKAVEAFAVQGIRLDHLRMRVEKAEDFPL